MPRSSTCTFPSHRATTLSARMEHPDGPVHATAVFAHCFGGSKDLPASRRLTRALAARGIAVLSLDFTGIGLADAEGTGTLTSDVDDLVAAAEYLTAEVTAPSLLVGHSLGGAAALLAAARIDGIEAVATVGAPADAAHVTGLFGDDIDTIRAQGHARVTIAGRCFTIHERFLDDLCDQKLLAAVGDLEAALLLLHAPRDAIVGVHNAALLFDAARHPKSFVSLADADHMLRHTADAQYAAEVIASWATRYLPDVPDSPVDDPEAITLPRGDGGYDEPFTTATTRRGLTTSIATRGFRLQADEPASAGGRETGPTPYDYLAAGLAACTSMTVRMYADRKQIPLTSVHTQVSFDRVHAADCAHCDTAEGRVELFTRTVTLEGDLDDAQRARLRDIADRCPVHRTLQGLIEIHTDLAP